MQIIADTHTHSIISGDAHSSIQENIAAAHQKGLTYIALTEHASAMPGAPVLNYFAALYVIPREVDGVRVLRGIEVDITDCNGGLDVPPQILRHLDWVIASMHVPVLSPSTAADYTEAWLAVVRNPLVDVLGHCGDPRYPFQHKQVVKACAEHGTIIEINAHSFKGRPGSLENCTKIAQLCMAYKVPVVVSSDAHFSGSIGEFQAAVEMLESISFPEHLILNADTERMEKAVQTLAAKKQNKTATVVATE